MLGGDPGEFRDDSGLGQRTFAGYHQQKKSQALPRTTGNMP